MDPSSNGVFFTQRSQPTEVIQGLISESQIVTLAGRIGVGKSPLLQDLTVHILTGHDWCGRKVSKRPVIALDFESPHFTYSVNIERMCDRIKVPRPHVPDELDACLELQHGSPLRQILSKQVHTRWEWLESRLKEKPNAAVIIDPLQIFVDLDTNKTAEVRAAYRTLRELMDLYPKSFFLLTFNMKKFQTVGRFGAPDLRSDPVGWLEYVSGTNYILTRSDVRLGVDRVEGEYRVVNGLQRGQPLTPILLEPVGDYPDLAGFQRIYHPTISSSLLTESQRNYFNEMPDSFKYSEVADKIIPHSTLDRMLPECVKLGLLIGPTEGVYVKRSPCRSPRMGVYNK